MSSTKQKAVQLSDRAWTLAKIGADQSDPPTSRPRWIEAAIHDRAKREGLVYVVPVSEELRSKRRKQV